MHIREDIGIPVLQFETETDLEMLGHLAARQDDSEHVVTWEVAGAAHVDKSLLEFGGQLGGNEADVTTTMWTR